MRERLQQRPVHRRTTAIVDADDAAQSMRASRGSNRAARMERNDDAPRPRHSTPAESNSTHACASKRSNSLRAPIRNSAAIPRRRSSHHRTSDCSRQFVREKKIPRRRRFHPRDQLRRLSSRCGLRTRGRVRGRRQPRQHIFPAAKAASRKPSQVARSPPAASSTTPRSKPLSRQNSLPAFHHDCLIGLNCTWLANHAVSFQPASSSTKSRGSRTGRRAAHFDQSFVPHGSQQRQQILAATRLIHFILFEQNVAQFR